MFDVFYYGPKPGLFEFEQPAESLMDAAEKSRTRHYWYIYGGNDYKDFDFDWQPVPWESTHTHVFPSQWQEDGRVYLANKYTVDQGQWHYHDTPKVRAINHEEIYYIDHGNPDSRVRLNSLQARGYKIRITRFVDNYLDIFRRIAKTATTDNVWIINSVCGYMSFDFSWHPSQWQRNMIHCFPTGVQKRGDTFYINVESFKQQMIDLEILDWFNVINYCNDQYVKKWNAPMHVYDTDDLITEVKNYDFKTPYVLFTNNKNFRTQESPCLWREKDRVIFSFSKDNSTALIPRDIKQHLNEQIYDYPYIETGSIPLGSQSSDVIFISNGESMAERHWQILGTICPWAKRSDGVTGREAAYKAAAELSDTPWFYAVFAKTEVLPDFKFDFVPDYFQEPKHYIFHSRNALNDLEYGAMNINLYNKRLVLETEPGLDFTLSKKHTVVPICASISRFNTDPWITWRSAFRETMKLQLEVDQGAGPEIQHRLHVWCTYAKGENAEYCLQGAQDGVEYYKSVNGDYEALKLSFDWAWCQGYYYKKYGRQIWLES